jgi:hypothetical protein
MQRGRSERESGLRLDVTTAQSNVSFPGTIQF